MNEIIKKLEKIINEEHGENVNAADQAIDYINSGVDVNFVYINTDCKFGVTCALTESEILDPKTWPDDWNYIGNTSDFTPVSDWVEEFDHDEN